MVACSFASRIGRGYRPTRIVVDRAKQIFPRSVLQRWGILSLGSARARAAFDVFHVFERGYLFAERSGEYRRIYGIAGQIELQRTSQSTAGADARTRARARGVATSLAVAVESARHRESVLDNKIGSPVFLRLPFYSLVIFPLQATVVPFGIQSVSMAFL